MTVFSAAYLQKAVQVFRSPKPLYSWREIVLGAPVRSATGGIRTMSAVAQNTFRGFHRSNKGCPGAKEAFVNYFVDGQDSLIAGLARVQSRDGMHELSNRITADLRSRLTNVVPLQLASFNKTRKPVDLYIEHLVAMAVEVTDLRDKLVPLLFLPLDSQILEEAELFTDEQLKSQRLNRQSTYAAISTEASYLHLQELLNKRSASQAANLGHPFPPIYFDLVWNSRYKNWGGNLFETNP